MLDEARPDLVDIVTPRADAPRRSCAPRRSAAIAIICQKPLAPTYAEAVALVEVAEARGHHARRARELPLAAVVSRSAPPDPGEARSARCIRSRSACGPATGRVRDAYLDRQPYFQRDAAVSRPRDRDPLDRHLPLSDGRDDVGVRRLRRINPAIAGEDAGYIVFEFAGGATGLFDGNRLNDHVATNPRRTMGEMWLEGSAGVLRLDGEARLWWKPHHEPELEHGYERGPDDTFGGGACGALQRMSSLISSTRRHSRTAGATTSPTSGSRRRYTARTRSGAGSTLA